MLSTNSTSIILISTLSLTWFLAFGSISPLPRHKINQFFRFDDESDSWVPVKLPYELVTCNNGNCTIVGSITETSEKAENVKNGDFTVKKDDEKEIYRRILPVRKRISLTKMSDASVWITGESGSIFERFWNGVQWVCAPHELPPSSSSSSSSLQPAVSVFFVNQTIFALSEDGILYQMQLVENTQLQWTKYEATIDQSAKGEREQIMIKSGVVTKDGEWINHGQPPGADVAAIADVGTLRSDLVFTISSAGDLYEHDKNTKPPWKKHIWREESAGHTSLLASMGCSARGLGGASSISLVLLTKAGELVERRLNHRKWKWIRHGRPEDELLTSITPVQDDESSEKYSVFLTTASGAIVEYQAAKQVGVAKEYQLVDSWINHLHPPHAKIAKGLSGIPYQYGRILFPLDDGRIAELHLPGFGGENSGPDHQSSTRKRSSLKYVWSIIDTPETEGWNAEYCTEERGPTNCMMGVKDESNELASSRTMTRRRRGMQQNYLIPEIDLENSLEEHVLEDNKVNENFRMRVIHGGRSLFLVSKSGLTFEYLYNDNVGVWLPHDHSTAMNGAVGSYNGSLFLVDVYGSLLIRQRTNDELQWLNCTAMKKGKAIIGGPPWDRIHSRKKVTENDAIYLTSKKGRLMQFTIALRNFKWKDCKNPVNTKIATIVDQEVCRDKVVFVIGTNGRLYQYNTLSRLWHEHYQSHHLILSRLPGSAMRPSPLSLECSLFMVSEHGGLVEYHWSSTDGWIWIEHGTPLEGVRVAGAPGPSFEGHQLFLVGSDGNVYLRFFEGEWKWRFFGFPNSENTHGACERQEKLKYQRNECFCGDKECEGDTEDPKLKKSDRNCDAKVASTRPIRSAENKVMFELRDGRLAEMHRVKDSDWIWSKIIATPTSFCKESFWADAST